MNTARWLDGATDWLARTERRTDPMAHWPAAGLAATLGVAPVQRDPGAPVPPLWHWLYFLSSPPGSDLRADGLARSDSVLPPVRLPSAMWAGGRLAFHRPLRLGHIVHRHSSVTHVTEKAGRTGPLVFIGLRHELRDDEGVLLVDEQDIVFRHPDAPGTAMRPPAVNTPAPQADWSDVVVPDVVMLFRYSALTFNSHRVHYDRTHAVEVERLPGLLVQAPLTATLLAESVRRHRPERVITAFVYRALGPLYEGLSLSLHGAEMPGGHRVVLWATDADGHMAMSATAELEPLSGRC